MKSQITNHKLQTNSNFLNSKYKNGLIIGIYNFVLVCILALGIWNFVWAQTAPEFLVSWRAINYAPADYQGKILPSKSSRVEIGFDLIDKNKIADLSKKNISWYLNGELLASGIGRKTAAFSFPSGLDQTIRIAVADYAANELEETILLPAANPEVIIDAKTPAKLFRNQNLLPIKNYVFEARPFFFNVSNLGELQFNWKINNSPVSGTPDNPEFLNLNLQTSGPARETELNVSVGAQNIFNQLELGSKLINFIIK